MPVPVRPDVSEENLRLLLAEGHETETLDYKSSCDLSQHDEMLEIVKDIAAMQIEGGYIVVGADDHGKPTDQLTATHIRLFEQASLRAKVIKYFTEPLDLRARAHEIDGHEYMLVYVGENIDGFAVCDALGNNSKGKSVFRKGDVFARHGTASELWNQHDITKIKRKLVERERERWLREATAAFAAGLPSVAATSIASGPASALTWQLDNDTFLEVMIEQIRKQDLLPLKLLLSRIPADIGKILTEDDAEEKVAVVLDRLTCLAALLLRVEQDGLFRSVVEAFVAIYNLPLRDTGVGKRLAPATLWLMVTQRTIGVGAYAERLKNWAAIRVLVLQKAKGYGDAGGSLRNWLRHTLTTASREGLLEIEQDGRSVNSPLLGFAQQQIDRLECLRTDLTTHDEEETLNSLCRFDILACLVAIDDAGSLTGGLYYPNFAKYYARRSIPAVIDLLNNQEMRNVLFHGSDEKLAEAISDVDDFARDDGRRFAGWDGLRDERIQSFMKQHKSRA